MPSTPFYRDPHFDRLMIHKCTMVKASVAASSSANYGHAEPSFSSGTTSYTLLPCRLRPLSQQELAAEGALGSQVADYYLDIACWAMPATMLNVSNAAALFRVESVTYRNVTLESGPLDIQGIAYPGGLLHHCMIRVRKIN
jgi:hypothetical protein